MDFRRFGKLPYEGGTFDQPADLLDEMRIVASIVEKAEAADRKRELDEARRRSRRR
jgi:hypothetical protein